jgi:prolactin regulatory element-binding protein
MSKKKSAPKVEESKVEESKVEESKVEESKVEESKVASSAKAPCYRVAEGKSLTSKRGIISAGKEIGPEDLPGGDDAFKVLREKGYITKD